MLRTLWYITVLINASSLTEVTSDNDKDMFYENLEKLFERLPKYNRKVMLGAFNAKIGREEKYRPTIGKYSLNEITNNNMSSLGYPNLARSKSKCR